MAEQTVEEGLANSLHSFANLLTIASGVSTDTIIQDVIDHRGAIQNYRYAKEILHLYGSAEIQGLELVKSKAIVQTFIPAGFAPSALVIKMADSLRKSTTYLHIPHFLESVEWPPPNRSELSCQEN